VSKTPLKQPKDQLKPGKHKAVLRFCFAERYVEALYLIFIYSPLKKS